MEYDQDKGVNQNQYKSEEIRSWVKSIAIAVIISLFIRVFVFRLTFVVGESMYPTLNEGDRLFVNKIGTIFGGYSRGDIVILKSPVVEHKSYVKRIIGVGGDKVEIKEGNIYLNGDKLDEDYIAEGFYIYNTNEVWEVPEGYVFVLGDNRGASLDSRYFGCVPVSYLKGRVEYRYYPINKKGKLGGN